MTVDTTDMSYNPLDDTGYQTVANGDQVSVAGIIDDAFFEDLEIDDLIDDERGYYDDEFEWHPAGPAWEYDWFDADTHSGTAAGGRNVVPNR